RVPPGSSLMVRCHRYLPAWTVTSAGQGPDRPRGEPVVTDLLDAINTVVIDAAGQPWVLAVLFACCVIDGFFPPVPSESIVVGLAAVAVSTGVPNLWLVVALTAAGAVVGDNIAFLIGRAVGTERFRWMRRPRVQAA